MGPLVLIGGLTFKNRGHLGSRYIDIIFRYVKMGTVTVAEDIFTKIFSFILFHGIFAKYLRKTTPHHRVDAVGQGLLCCGQSHFCAGPKEVRVPPSHVVRKKVQKISTKSTGFLPKSFLDMLKLNNMMFVGCGTLVASRSLRLKNSLRASRF